MSEGVHSARGGEFATGRRASVAADADFILAQRDKGVPVSAVAKMLRRAESDVRLIYSATLTAVEGSQVTAPAPAQRAAKAGSKRSAKPKVAAAKRQPPTRAFDIIQSVAARHGLSAGALLSGVHPRKLAPARQAAFHALYATDRYSLPQIGSWFGRDHTTVLSGIRAHMARKQADLAAWQALGRNRPQICVDSRHIHTPASANETRIGGDSAA